MRRTTRLILPLLPLALLALPSPASAQSGTEATLEGGLVKAGSAPDAFLLYTGDVIGYLDPCG